MHTRERGIEALVRHSVPAVTIYNNKFTLINPPRRNNRSEILFKHHHWLLIMICICIAYLLSANHAALGNMQSHNFAFGVTLMLPLSTVPQKATKPQERRKCLKLRRPCGVHDSLRNPNIFVSILVSLRERGKREEGGACQALFDYSGGQCPIVISPPSRRLHVMINSENGETIDI